jgi:hypothetical protein
MTDCCHLLQLLLLVLFLLLDCCSTDFASYSCYHFGGVVAAVAVALVVSFVEHGHDFGHWQNTLLSCLGLLLFS